MEKKSFTFVSLTYNHQNYIIMHLESIKYQIERYGLSRSVSIIIADDASVDDTVRLAEQWLEINKSLFQKIIFLKHTKNQGTCKNISRVFQYIMTDYFKILAGDDVYSCYSIFDMAEYLQTYDIVSSPAPAFWMDRKGLFNIDDIYNHYKYSIAIGLSPKYMYRIFTVAGCLLEAPPTIYRNGLIKDGTLEFVQKFRLIEDQPLLYYMFKYNKINVYYTNMPTVLYRINSNSVSHTKDTFISECSHRDQNLLCNYYLNNERNILYKYVAKLRLKALNVSERYEILFPTNHYIMLKQRLCKGKIRETFETAVFQNKVLFEEHLNMLYERTEVYMKGYLWKR